MFQPILKASIEKKATYIFVGLEIQKNLKIRLININLKYQKSLYSLIITIIQMKI